MIGPGAVASGVRCGAKAGEGSEVVGEVGLVVIAASKCELRPANIDASMHLLDSLLKALDATVKLGRDAHLLGETLG